MKTFNVYKHPTHGIEAVKVGFSWPAFFFGILWMLVKKLWGLAGAWFAAYIMLSLVEIVSGHSGEGGGAQALVYLILAAGYFTLWLAPAFKGNKWREENLSKRGYEHLTTVQAETPDAAVAPAVGLVASAHSLVAHQPAVTVEANFSKHVLSASDSTIPLQTVVDEDHVYAEIAKELEIGVADKGLWTRLFAECSGDENQTKVLYIKQRAQRLIAAERARMEQAERERAAEADRIEKERLNQVAEALGIKEDWNKNRLKKIHNLAKKHLSDPRMTIDEKEQLLRIAGGSFKWGEGSKCSAMFRGEEREFPSGKDFSVWFETQAVPFLLSIEVIE